MFAVLIETSLATTLGEAASLHLHFVNMLYLIIELASHQYIQETAGFSFIDAKKCIKRQKMQQDSF